MSNPDAHLVTVVCNDVHWNSKTIEAFKTAYGEAVQARVAEFTFDGRSFSTGGARRIINYVNSILYA